MAFAVSYHPVLERETKFQFSIPRPMTVLVFSQAGLDT